MYIFCLIVFSFFACIGLLHFIDAVLNSACRYENSSILILKALSADNAEARVRRAASACAELRCEHLMCECRDQEAQAICEKLKKTYPIIEIISTECGDHPEAENKN